MASPKILFFVFFFLIVGLIQSFAFWSFKKFTKKNPYIPFIPKNRLRGKIWTVLTVLPFIIFNLPYIYLVTNHMDFSTLPQWLYKLYVIPFFIFQAAIIFLGILFLVMKLVKLPFLLFYYITNKIRFFKQKYSAYKENKTYQKFDNSRRRFIKAGGVLLTGYAFTSASIGVLRKDEYVVTNQEVFIENLPMELNGLRVLLISDIHSGPYMQEGQMKHYCDVLNSYNADIILIPGDLTNSQRTEAAPFTKAFRDIKAKHGVYATLGNHDYFHDAEYVAKAVINETPVKLMRNESRIIEINNKKLLLMGMEDTRTSGANLDPVVYQYFDKTVAGAKDLVKSGNIEFDSIPKILLYHKPYFFEDFSKEKIDLTVSGHTHGGQIVFAKYGNFNLSIAAAVSKYVEGFFTNGNNNMYVSRGIGAVGLPLRLNCPPEITILTLKQKSPAEN
ncbi:MAG: metallophosphoesterase [Ignavibacteria bacterium]|nr:metallophosphoesterase [Ignavibacteria bacterium]